MVERNEKVYLTGGECRAFADLLRRVWSGEVVEPSLEGGVANRVPMVENRSKPPIYDAAFFRVLEDGYAPEDTNNMSRGTVRIRAGCLHSTGDDYLSN